MKKKRTYKFLEEGKSQRTCCRLEYWKGSVLDGISIVLVDKENEDNGQCIDIPQKEFKHLRQVLDKEEQNEKIG